MNYMRSSRHKARWSPRQPHLDLREGLRQIYILLSNGYMTLPWTVQVGSSVLEVPIPERITISWSPGIQGMEPQINLSVQMAVPQ